MDILRDNFSEKYDLIIDSVKTCDFITLDTEFSGLNVGYEDQSSGFDQSEDRYQKLKHNCDRMNAF